jgi:hypothetical protein
MKDIGYLYVLANSAMPNMVKVGKTTRSPLERAEELSRATGLPTPFIVVYEQLFADFGAAESFVHVYLETKGYRVANNREFFNAPVSTIVKAIALAPNAIDNESPTLEPEINDDSLRDSDESNELDDLSFDETKLTYPWTEVFEEAEAHYYGYGNCIQDYSEALRLFKQAAKLGALPAYGYIGKMYQNGEGVRQDKNKALEFYKEGVKKGSVYCYWAMAMLFKEEGNKQNMEKCFALFLNNKPDILLDERYLTADELSAIFLNCFQFGFWKITDGDEVPFILNKFIIENLTSISNKGKSFTNTCIKFNKLELIENCKLTLQYFESLASKIKK